MKLERIFLISCVSGKREYPSPAAEMYVSPWFRKARDLVQKSGQPWFILSAEHGLLAPEMSIAPYNRTLNRMPAAERRAWAEKVKAQMPETLPEADEVVLLAGLRYREHLMAALTARFRKVRIPMLGLSIGRQLQWLSHATQI